MKNIQKIFCTNQSDCLYCIHLNIKIASKNNNINKYCNKLIRKYIKSVNNHNSS